MKHQNIEKILVSFSLSLLCISLIVTLAISHSFLFFQVPQRREPQAISPTLQLSSFSVLSGRLSAFERQYEKAKISSMFLPAIVFRDGFCIWTLSPPHC